MKNSKKSTIKKPRKSNISIRCNYCGMPGIGWDFRVTFKPIGDSFEVWVFECNAIEEKGVWRHESTIQQNLTWRSVCQYFLGQDEVHVWGGLWMEKIEVKGLSFYAADLVRVAFIEDDEVQFPYKDLLRLLLEFTDSELKEIQNSYGSLFDAIAAIKELGEECDDDGGLFYGQKLSHLAEMTKALNFTGLSLAKIKERLNLSEDANLDDILHSCSKLVAETLINKLRKDSIYEEPAVDNSIEPTVGEVTEAQNNPPPKKSYLQTMIDSGDASELDAREVIPLLLKVDIPDYSVKLWHHRGLWAVLVWLFRYPENVYKAVESIRNTSYSQASNFIEMVMRLSNPNVSNFTEKYWCPGGAMGGVGRSMLQDRVIVGVYCQNIADTLKLPFPEELRIGDLPFWGDRTESLNAARNFRFTNSD